MLFLDIELKMEKKTEREALIITAKTDRAQCSQGFLQLWPPHTVSHKNNLGRKEINLAAAKPESSHPYIPFNLGEKRFSGPLQQGWEGSFLGKRKAAVPTNIPVGKGIWKPKASDVSPDNQANIHLNTMVRTQILCLQTKAWVGGMKQIIT